MITLATKQDIAEIKKEMLQMKYDLVKWQLGIVFALIMIMVKGFAWLAL